MEEVDTISDDDLEAAASFYDNILEKQVYRKNKFVVPENILKLKDNEIFVFGSNMAGIHGAGAALFAKKLFGAKQGIGYGLVGKTFAIPTKDQHIQTLPLSKVKQYIDSFLNEAKKLPNLNFLVTRVGCGLAGFKDEQIAPLFKDSTDNVLLPEQWKNI